MIWINFLLPFGKFLRHCKCRMSEIEYVPGGTKVIKSVFITTDNPRLSTPCPPATHPQIWNPLEYEKKTFQKAQQTYRQCAHPQMWNPPKYEKHFKWRNIPVFLKKQFFTASKALLSGFTKDPALVISQILTAISNKIAAKSWSDFRPQTITKILFLGPWWC